MEVGTGSTTRESGPSDEAATAERALAPGAPHYPPFEPRQRFKGLGGSRRPEEPSRLQQLQRAVDGLTAENEGLTRAVHHQAADLRALEQKHDELLRDYRRAASEVERLNQVIRAKDRQLEALDRDLASAREEKDRHLRILDRNLALALEEKEALNSRLNRMIREVAAQNRNRTGTFVSDDRPRTHLLLQEFKDLRDQRIVEISHLLVSRSSDADSLPGLDRKKRMVRLRVAFARALVDSPVEGTLPESGVDAAQDTADAMHPRFQECARSIIGGPVPDDISPSLLQLVRDFRMLVRRMEQTDPPGRLVHASAGDAFDPARHLPVMGNPASGTVEAMVFPGYGVEDVLHEKVLVQTLRTS